VDTVLAIQRRQAEVGNNEPLRSEAVAFILAGGRLGDHRVDAGLQLRNSLTDRHSRRHFLVEAARDCHLSLVDQRAVLSLSVSSS
jgi:hypothetical protein